MLGALIGSVVGAVRAVVFGGLVFLVLQLVSITPLADIVEKSAPYRMLQTHVYTPLKNWVALSLSKQPQLHKQLNKVAEQWTQLGKFMDPNITRLYNINQLPNVNQGRTVHLPNGVSIAAGDDQVSERELKLGASILTQVSVSILKENLGVTPQNTNIALFSSKQSYAAALAMAGVGSQDILSMAAKTGGITAGSDIWINWAALQSNSDLANIFTHEVTHAVFNQEGISDSVPTWVNEGTAWFDGMDAQRKVSSVEADQIIHANNEQLRRAAQSGQLLPLSASERDILNASYNVEWEDYRAVHELVQRYGLTKYREFIEGAKNGTEKSFLSNFGISMQTYTKNFEAEISQR
ncbi:hypothetical protein AYW79_04450 [Ferroacidibacillus organovorans]|uniref:Peptidase MA-like domain-containing protein n=1 Tax=Ferroacidibacillus organovorans TaxID=1765683 RepID=A0A853KDV3_9BACL|nr:hypothetical protein AYJ22_03165 [Ferroacidibacillus organovorans]OAG94611.1 hypothetical protein AYW79_04450 [Ferroacidibacillus organovorans]